MASADDYAAWIEKNKDKRGTPQFNDFAEAYRQALAEESSGGQDSQPPKYLTGDDVRNYYADPKNRRNPIQDAAALTYGVMTGAVGTPGELEGFGRAGLNYFGADVAPEPVLPTIKQVQSAGTRYAGFPDVKDDPRVAAGEIMPGLVAAGKLLTKVPGAISSTAKRLATVLTRRTERNVAPLVNEIRDVVGPQALRTATTDASAASNEAKRAARMADVIRTKAAHSPQPNLSTIGEAKPASEIGSNLQRAGLANEDAITVARNAADDTLRTAQQAIVATEEASGRTIASTPSYKALIKEAKEIADDNPLGPTIMAETDPGVRKIYSDLISRLGPQKIPVDADTYRKAEKLGRKVSITSGPDGEDIYTVTRMPSFNSADNARRWLGDVFSKKVAGYGNISKVAQERLYFLLKNIEEEYVGALPQKNLQKNWSDAAANLAKFDTKLGKTLTGEQKMTGVASTLPADVPGRFFGKGPQGFQQALDLTDNPSVAQRAAGDWAAALLYGKSPKVVENTLSDNNRLAGMLRHPSLGPLKENVREYGFNVKRSDTLARILAGKEKLAAKTASTADSASKIQRQIIARNYDAMPQREVVNAAMTDLKADLVAGRITETQFSSTAAKIAEAQRLYGKSDKLNKVVEHVVRGTAAGVGVGAGFGAGKAGIEYIVP